jgi:hypothetical protein
MPYPMRHPRMVTLGPRRPVEKPAAPRYKYSSTVCNDWEELKAQWASKLYDGRPFQRGLFLFRGQGSCKYPLKPSFDRWFSGDRSQKKSSSQRLLQFFRDEIIGLEVERSLAEDDDRLVALAQHHGVPTRLLDWTESPYIAAFFALSGAARSSNPTDHAAVWCIDLREKDVWDSE